LFDISLTVIIGRVVGLLIGFTVHEWAHAYSAYRLGDSTAYNRGRLTLDPRAHLDPFGLILALLAGFGWAKPVPTNPNAFYPKERRGLMVVALSGPVTNLIIAFFFALALRLMLAVDLIYETRFFLTSTGATIVQGDGELMQFILEVMSTVIVFNLLLFFFNLIPLSPLDGWKIMLGLLPDKDAYRIAQYERQSFMLLTVILMIGFIIPALNIIAFVFQPFLRFFFELFTGFGYYIGTV
jgi:Zn-dependent protease